MNNHQASINYFGAGYQDQEEQDQEEEEEDEEEGRIHRDDGDKRAKGQEGGQQMLWIKRRRLERDRAREPPAWLRERPIRSGSQVYVAVTTPADDNDDENNDDDDNAAATATDQSGDLAGAQLLQPRVLIESRQSRDSGGQLDETANEFYDTLVAHLVEEALDGREYLADLYGNLESRLDGEAAAAASPQDKSLALIDSQPSRASPPANGAKHLTGGEFFQRQQQQSTNGPARNNKLLVSQLQQQQQQPQPNANQDESQLHVAGDEISDNDDVILVPSKANAAAALSEIGQQQQQQESPTAALIGSPQLAGSNVEQLLAVDGYHQPGEDQLAGGGGGVASAGLIDLLRTSLDTAERRQPALIINNAGDQFHVVEDVDSIGDPQAPNDGQTQMPYAQGGGGDGAQIVGWLPMSSGSDDDDNNNNYKSAIMPRPGKRLAAYRFNDNNNDKLQQAIRQQLAPAEVPTLSWQQANDSNGQQISAALKLIKSGFFSREQLIGIATRLRNQLEDFLNLPQNSIVGLFPIGDNQLLTQLDLSKLSASERYNLIQNRNYNPSQATLTIHWPRKSWQNPLPVLGAILDSLNTEDTTPAQDGRRVKLMETIGAEVGQMGDQIGDNDDQTASDGGDLEAGAELGPVVVYPAAPNELGAQRNTRQLASRVRQQVGAARNWRPVMAYEPPIVDDDFGGGNFDSGAAYAADTPAKLISWNLAPAAAAASWRTQMMEPNMGPVGRLWAAQQMQQQPPPLGRLASSQAALLAAYLAVGQSLLSRPLMEIARAPPDATGDLAPQQPVASASHSTTRASSGTTLDYMRDSHFIHLIIVLLALMSAYLIVKLLVRRHKPASGSTCCVGGSWRPHWLSYGRVDDEISSSSSSSGGGEKTTSVAHYSSGAHEKQAIGLDASNPLAARRLSADSGLETTLGAGGGGANEPDSCDTWNRRNLDLLGQRLLAMLRPFESKQAAAESCESANLQKQQIHDSKQQPDIEAAALEYQVPQEATGLPATDSNARFRTSRSYIKSLIDALTKARSRVFEDPNCGADDEDDGDDDDRRRLVADNDADNELEARRHLSGASVLGAADDELGGSGGIVVSQMDISAAHLILDYMEKHLEDKERLRREWLELNGNDQSLRQHSTTKPQTVNSSSNNNNQAQQQLILQRLAKVALSNENLVKNRNQAVVPFDRNRVRLGRAASLSPSSSSVVGASNGSPPLGAASARRRPKSDPRWSPSPSSSLSKSPPRTAANSMRSDYINASFIYDAEPRCPTHIIAQGPDEQTIGQFWQMIWEQQVSVIVMLTRLNENGHCQCHRYWPTTGNVGAEANSGGAPAQPTPTSPRQANGIALAPVSGPRRGSTTSLASQGSVQALANQKIIGATSSASSASSTSSASASASPALSYHQQPAPIIANIGELGNNNIICFDLPATSCDAAAATATKSANNQGDQIAEKNNTGLVASSHRVEVHLISEHVSSSSDYVVRNMYLLDRSSGETRTMTQFHYLAWPVDRVPDNVHSLLQFRRKVHKSYRNLKSPILVHCSDGAGRSGTYTLLDIILERIKNGAKEIDPRATLEHLRDQRVGLCATQSQFEFVLVALAEEIQLILNALPK